MGPALAPRGPHALTIRIRCATVETAPSAARHAYPWKGPGFPLQPARRVIVRFSGATVSRETLGRVPESGRLPRTRARARARNRRRTPFHAGRDFVRQRQEIQRDVVNVDPFVIQNHAPSSAVLRRCCVLRARARVRVRVRVRRGSSIRGQTLEWSLNDLRRSMPLPKSVLGGTIGGLVGAVLGPRRERHRTALWAHTRMPPPARQAPARSMSLGARPFESSAGTWRPHPAELHPAPVPHDGCKDLAPSYSTGLPAA